MSTLELNYQDMIIRVAEFLGVPYYGAAGNEAAQVPTNARHLDQCERIVNDGWRRFYNSKTRWNWMRKDFDILFDPDGTSGINIDGDNWRYYMPDGFYGQIISWPIYQENGPRIRMAETTPEDIRERYGTSVTTGNPSLFALEPIVDDPKSRWAFLVWPKPSVAYTVSGKCRVYPNKLIEHTDTPNCGFVFSEMVMAACYAEAELQEETAGERMEMWNEAMMRAHMIDNSMSPKRMGTLTGQRRRGWYDGVDGYYDVAGNLVADFN